MRDCNELNTNLRAKPTNEFEKDFFRLMNNSVFGKTMENIRSLVDVRLVSNFHYNCIMKYIYGDHVKLLLSDTDSLAYEITTKDFYKDISGDVKGKFDRSKFPKDHPSDIPTSCNKKVVRTMKVKANRNIMDEFLGLRAKLYNYKMTMGKEEKKCKGI